jgi:GNAT superfamily N-acetyltransferase
MGKRIYAISSEYDFECSFPVMKELRPHLSYADYKEIYQHAHTSDGYQIIALEENGKIAALMGYRVLSDFVRGKHLYIDDLVSTQKARSKGLGTELLKYAENLAEQLDCKILRLCTGIENERGAIFYERNGWTKRAYAYTKKLT